MVSRNEVENCEISGSHSAEYEDGCLLGCCATIQKTATFKLKILAIPKSFADSDKINYS
jgi:hypothetical protein